MVVVVIACSGTDKGGPVTAPTTTGQLLITVTTTGPRLGVTEFGIKVGASEESVGVNAVADFAALIPGVYTVELTRVPSNCIVLPSASQTIRVAAGDTATGAFSVACTELTGVVAYTIQNTSTLAYELHSLNLVTHTDKTLLTTPGVLAEPRWSPDGTELAYTMGSTLWVVRADGTAARALFAGSNQQSSPSWLPDGSRIGFVEHTAGRTAGVYSVRAAGGGVQLVLADSSANAVTWSHTGAIAVVLAESPRMAQSGFGVYSLPSVGGEARRISTIGNWNDEFPAWSPDGKALVFLRLTRIVPDVVSSAYYTVQADGSSERVVSGAGGSGQGLGEISWSPDGVSFAYQEGTATLRTVNTDGTSNAFLVFGAFPSWKP